MKTKKDLSHGKFLSAIFIVFAGQLILNSSQDLQYELGKSFYNLFSLWPNLLLTIGNLVLLYYMWHWKKRAVYLFFIFNAVQDVSLLLLGIFGLIYAIFFFAIWGIALYRKWNLFK